MAEYCAYGWTDAHPPSCRARPSITLSRKHCYVQQVFALVAGLLVYAFRIAARLGGREVLYMCFCFCLL